MLHDIKFSKNPSRFTITTSPTGVMMTYKDPESGEEFQLNAAEYKMYKEGGNDLVGVTNEEDFNKFMTACSLSRWVLWNKPTISASIKDYKKRFNLK